MLQILIRFSSPVPFVLIYIILLLLAPHSSHHPPPPFLYPPFQCLMSVVYVTDYNDYERIYFEISIDL
jgi:hypothetical protein